MNHTLNRAQRRMLQRRGIDPSRAGKVYNKTNAPTTPEEFEAALLEIGSDPQKLSAAVANGEFAGMVRGYVGAQNGVMVDLRNQLKEETQATLVQWLKDNQADLKQVNRLDLDPTKAPAKYSPISNKRAIGAPLNGQFEDLGEFVTAAWHFGQKNSATPKALQEKIDVVNTYQEKVGSDGGFLVPEEFRAELLRLTLDSAIVRPRARVVPMSSATLRFPAIDETSHASSVFGGIVVYRTEEGADLVESSATFGSIKLEASKQTALAYVTNELVRDAAGGFTMYVEQMFPEAIAWYEDSDFLGGTGVGEPLGSLNAGNTSIITVAKETGQAGSTIVWENVLKMYSRMLPSSIERAVWVVTPDAFVELATMALSVGTGGSAVWITDAAGAPRLTLLGRPVIMTEKAPAVLGSQGDISFIDFGMYLIGDRQQMTVDSSPHVKFASDKTAYRVIQRNDGRPWLQSALTPKNGGPTLSPFVQLAVRS